MDRILEPELMLSPKQCSAYAKADFSRPHGDFITHFQRCFGEIKKNAYVLDLGCGPADISMRFAKIFSSCWIDAVDGSSNMLKIAADLIAARQLTGRINLLLNTLQNLSLSKKYDVILSNSLLHHLSRPELLWQSILATGREQGIVFIMDLSRPDTTEIAAKIVQKYASSELEILQHDFYHSLCAAFTIDEIRAQIETNSLGHLEIEKISDRHFIVYGKLIG